MPNNNYYNWFSEAIEPPSMQRAAYTFTVMDEATGVTTTRTQRGRARDARGRFVSAEQAARANHTLVTGDYVTIAPGAQAGGMPVEQSYIGPVMQLDGHRNGRRDTWIARGFPDRNGTYVDEQYLTWVDINAVPFQCVLEGDRVKISANPYLRSDGTGAVGYSYANQEALVVGTRSGNRFLVRLTDGDSAGAENYIHASCLTTVERNGRRHVSGAETVPAPLRCRNVSYCSREITDDNPVVETGSSSRGGCEACTQQCEGCDRRYRRVDYALEYVNGENRCRSCYVTCDDCSSYYVDDGDGCPNYEDHELPRGVHGYGHTSASMWLGGPLPRRADGGHDGYYIGIELEISASYEQSAMPIYDWAEQHLGHRDAIVCKEDSSVRGFEIVTQPMTPAKFESVDWESFMDLLNTNHPLGRNRDDEPTEHGLHVHIGRVAFQRDDVATAAYCYLMGQGDHMERIGRRAAYHYCAKVQHPVQAAIASMSSMSGKSGVQVTKIARRGIYAGRDAINLQNRETIEIRAFRSTRSADYLRNAVRMTYLAADYVRYLRVNKEAVSPKSLHWSAFARWVGQVHPEAFASIAGIEHKGSNRAQSLALVGAASVNWDM